VTYREGVAFCFRLQPELNQPADRIRPLGRAFDPRAALIKDTPGPLMVLELGIEVTV
jgi:hypothetical protein